MHLRDFLRPADGPPVTATWLATKMGVSHTTVMRWADGTIKPNTDTLARLYEATGGKVTPNDMALPQQAAA